MHDGILVVNELLDSRLKSKVPGFMLKLDFQKAFDTVSWDFLDSLLEKYGFGSKWRFWLRANCISARFSVLVEGAPVGFFPSSRGLR